MSMYAGAFAVLLDVSGFALEDSEIAEPDIARPGLELAAGAVGSFSTTGAGVSLPSSFSRPALIFAS